MTKVLRNPLFIFLIAALLLSGAQGLSKGDGGGISASVTCSPGQGLIFNG
jgi:hypothetical protein